MKAALLRQVQVPRQSRSRQSRSHGQKTGPAQLYRHPFLGTNPVTILLSWPPVG